MKRTLQQLSSIANSAMTVSLPLGGVRRGLLLLALVAIMMPIGAWAQETTPEAKWGASAASLTHEGTLVEAIRAAEESSDVAYIQLQSSVTTTDDHVIFGGTFTLDLNGHTLTRDVYTLDIWSEGTSVTLTDSSEDGAGKVVSTGGGCAAVFLYDGAHVTIEGGCYESAHMAVIIQSGCSATISGGTFLGNSGTCFVDNDGTLIITGGTFAEGSTGTFVYSGGKLDLTGYPTTEVEGTTPLTEVSVYNFSGSIAVDATTLVLPTGYCFYNSSGQAVTVLDDEKYTIGVEGSGETTAEAKWGASAASLTHEGTLAEAIKAAVVDYDRGDYTASDVAYIQLQSSGTTTGDHVIYGGTFTLDLNGHTLTSDGYTLDIRNEGTSVTLTDSSEDGEGKVVSTGSSAAAVDIFWGAHVTIEGGCYESASTAVSVESDCSATISGGTFLGSSSSTVYNNGSLIISGGTFGGEGIQSSVYAGNSSVSTTITGGTFAEASTGTIAYYSGKLDLTGYPTTETEGTTPLTAVSVYNVSGSIAVDATTIALPMGYCFYNSIGQAVTMLEYDKKYTIGAEPDAKYTVTFAPNGGSGEMADGISYGYGGYVLPECAFTAPEGKMFKAWQVGDEEYQPGETITVTENTTVTAVWRDYVPQLILELTDSYGDGWNGASITVKENGEEIGTATIPTGGTATIRYDYDNTGEYTFYWAKGGYDSECSFVIKVEDETVLTASTEDCNGYEDGKLIHTIGAVGGGGTTEIAPSTLNPSPSTIIYDLAGHRVEQPTKGIYIVNGRKVIF